MATTVTLTSGGNLATGIATLSAAGGGDLILGPGTYTGGVDLSALGGPIRIKGSLGSAHTLIDGPSNANCLSVANMTHVVTLEGITLDGPTAAGFVTLYGVTSAGIHFDDVVITGGGGNAATFLDRVAGLRWRRLVIRDVLGTPGVKDNPIGLWLFGGSGSGYCIGEDVLVQNADGSGITIDAGSSTEDAASSVGLQLGIVRLVDVALDATAAAGLDIQSGCDIQIGQLYIEGTVSGPAALSIKEDQYFGQADVFKPRNIDIGQLMTKDCLGTLVYLSGAHNIHIGSMIAIGATGALVIAVGGNGGGAGGGSDHTCHDNVIDYLDWSRSPSTTGVSFDSTVAAVTATTIRHATPDGLPRTYTGGASRTGRTRNTVMPY